MKVKITIIHLDLLNLELLSDIGFLEASLREIVYFSHVC